MLIVISTVVVIVVVVVATITTRQNRRHHHHYQHHHNHHHHHYNNRCRRHHCYHRRQAMVGEWGWRRILSGETGTTLLVKTLVSIRISSSLLLLESLLVLSFFPCLFVSLLWPLEMVDCCIGGISVSVFDLNKLFQMDVNSYVWIRFIT